MPWPTKKLGEICEKIKAGGTPRRDNLLYWNGNIPFVKIEDITSTRKYITSTSEKISEEGLNHSNTWLVPAECILLSIYASVGEVAINKIPVATNQAILGIVPDRKIVLTDFLFYALKKFGKNLLQYRIESTQKNVTLEIVKNFPIPLPPLPIQQKIVFILDTIQSAIDSQNKIIETTKELKKSLMADLFKYGGPSFRKGRKLKKTEIGEIPENWEVVELGERYVSEIIMGQSPSSKYYNENREGLPFLQGKAEFGEIYPIPIKWCSKPIKISQQNDILISVRAPVGDVNLANQRYCIGRGLAAIRCGKKIDAKFLFNYLIFGKEKLIKDSSGSTFKAIKKGDLINFKIPLPPLPEQREIADILQTIDQKIEIEQKKKALYEELFKTMLNKLMNGEIDV
ncbi:MAG: restriction endonuclease subunit S, partial [Candidatus Omnitrophica bacterium]|nr:restriction endonuclease subunit S [Candidatus Omnitrophota bacterium]